MPNHLSVATGDLVVLRTNRGSLGVAKIEDIQVEEKFLKKRLRCPHCGRMRFNERKNATPKYMCRREDCMQPFDAADERWEEVTRFTAVYQGTWQRLSLALTAQQLDDLALTKSKQNAIRKLDIEGLEALLTDVGMPLPPDPVDRSAPAPSKPIVGGRTRRSGLVRIGQPEFRKALLERYGPACLITGPAPEEALEAAHLRAFAEHGRHVPEEGAMLRADIHMLFDKGLIAVDPERLVVALDPRLRAYDNYAALAGKPVEVLKGAMPCLEALKDHFAEATSRWLEVDVFWRPSRPIDVSALFR
ncbi:HNH endonuclease [Lentzea sp. NPDC060358]|uniref:HNH endonuclease n=1 Tax=Lentzea sp. NPDC060358 TaxID=3347103 RepID=UPI00364BEE3B